MKSVKKLLCSILAISFVSIILIKNVVYADVYWGFEEPYEPHVVFNYNYSSLYYISIIIAIAIVVGISILILRKIYKSNQLEKENNEKIEKGVKNNDKS